jgi:hypothetical protein
MLDARMLSCVFHGAGDSCRVCVCVSVCVQVSLHVSHVCGTVWGRQFSFWLRGFVQDSCPIVWGFLLTGYLLIEWGTKCSQV